MAIDEAALIAAYRRLETPLHSAVLRLLWDAHESQDAVHEAFLRVWAMRERVDAARLEALLWTSALNLARNRLRWLGLRRWLGLQPEDAVAGDDPAQMAEQSRLRAALEQLTPAQREVVLLSEFGGFDTRELAAMLRVPEGTVATRKHHAVRRLRQLLGGGDG